MYRKYRILECIASSVSQYESYRDQVYRYTLNLYDINHDIRLYYTHYMWYHSISYFIEKM